MDEIRAYCGALSAGSEVERGDAYVWLLECRPFTALARRFQGNGITFLQTAALLGPNAVGSQTELALGFLSAAIAASAMPGHRFATNAEPVPA